MRMLKVVGTCAALGALFAVGTARAQEAAFDACEVFTPAEAEKALGIPVAAEPFSTNPKVKRPKVIPNCNYLGNKDGKAVAATALFRFGKTEADAQKAFDDARMQFQTKPVLISGAEAFWSAKTGQMNLRKGRTWITVSVGPEKLNERDWNDARKLAETLAKKF